MKRHAPWGSTKRARFVVPLTAALFASPSALAQKPAKDAPKPTTPHDAAEVEAKPPERAPASATEPLPDPTPGPDPFRNDASSTWATSPTSASGTELVPTTAGPSLGGGGQGQGDARAADRDATVRALEQRVAILEAERERERQHGSWLSMIKVSGYLQPQLVWSWFNAAASPNAGSSGLPNGITSNDVTAKSDGTTTNPDFFRLRRARLKLEITPVEYATAVFEIDPNLLGGKDAATGTVARNVEAIGRVPWSRDVRTDFGMGMFKVPFSHEIIESDADRPFIERSFGEQNMFPGEFDTGIRAVTHAAFERFNAQVAVVNGTMIGERNFSVVPDLNKGKDFVAHVNYDFGLFDLGAGGYYGQGQGVDAAALRFKQFPRWAVEVEGGIHHTFVKKLGATRFFVEFTMANSMDRGVRYGFALPAVPSDVRNDVDGKDERNLQFRFEQDVTRWLTLGARYDSYAPDTAQGDDLRRTYSFVSAVHFTKALTWMLEVDHADDHIHAPGAGVPHRAIETLSNVLQARF